MSSSLEKYKSRLFARPDGRLKKGQFDEKVCLLCGRQGGDAYLYREEKKYSGGYAYILCEYCHETQDFPLDLRIFLSSDPYAFYSEMIHQKYASTMLSANDFSTTS